MIASICLASSDFSCSGSESESKWAGLDNCEGESAWCVTGRSGQDNESGTDLIVELDGLDHPFIGVEQGTDIFFLLDKLDVSDNGPSSRFGLVQVFLDLWAFLHRLVLSINVLEASAHYHQTFVSLGLDPLYRS